MASINQRNGRLFFDFRWQGKRYREYTEVPDTPGNGIDKYASFPPKAGFSLQKATFILQSIKKKLICLYSNNKKHIRFF